MATRRFRVARAVSLEVSLACYGLVVDFLDQSRRVGTVDSRGITEFSPYPNAPGYILCDSFASQSGSSLTTVTGLTVSSGGEAVTNLRQSLINAPGRSHWVVAVGTLDIEDVPLAVLADRERLRRVKKKKKAVGCLKLDAKESPIPFVIVVVMKEDEYLQKKGCSDYLGRMSLQQNQKFLWTITAWVLPQDSSYERLNERSRCLWDEMH